MDLQSKVYNEDEEQENDKLKIGQRLFNEDYPDMITIVQAQEIHKLSVLSIICREENLVRLRLQKKGKIECNDLNILGEVINKQLVLRTSINGSRAEQGVRIISAILEQQMQQSNDIGNKITNMIRGK